jgi:diacylglycerol kinase
VGQGRYAKKRGICDGKDGIIAMKSFVHAWRGIVHSVKTERNVRIHLAAAYYVVIAGLLIDFYLWEWALVALACGLVLGAELLNTALERLCDGLEPGHSSVVKSVKDLTAGAVLVCAIVAAAVAVFLFVDHRDSFWQWVYPQDLLGEPVFWAGLIPLPLWFVFVFFLGRKK